MHGTCSIVAVLFRGMLTFTHTQAFIITQDGVVLKDGPDAAWLILKKDFLGKFKSIGRMSTRPTASDLEAAFVNAAAVDSPVNKGIAFVRSKLPF